MQLLYHIWYNICTYTLTVQLVYQIHLRCNVCIIHIKVHLLYRIYLRCRCNFYIIFIYGASFVSNTFTVQQVYQKYLRCNFCIIYISAPRYLAIECTPVAGVTGRSHLRSAASGDVLVPACQTLTIGPLAFVVACPRAWNSLPRHLRRPGISLTVFKKELKTELFRRMLDDKR